MSDDTPTESLSSAADPSDLAASEAAAETVVAADSASPQSAISPARKYFIWLAVLGGLLLLAIIVIVALLFSPQPIKLYPDGDPVVRPTASESETPSPSPSTKPTPTPTPSVKPSQTPSPKPSESPSASPAPPAIPDAVGPRFTKFEYPKQMNCVAGSADYDPKYPYVTVAWATVDAKSAWYSYGVADGADSAFMEIPLKGDESDFAYPQRISCAKDEARFTITLVGYDGTHVSKTWTVKLTGDRF